MKHYSVVALAFLLTACTSTPQQGDTIVESRVLDSLTVSITATVVDINYEERVVAIENENGIVVLSATPDVEQFDDLKVGDPVNIEYTESVAMHVQTQDGDTRIQTFGDLEKLTEGVDAVEQIQVISDILAIDTENQTVTLKQPHGGEVVLPVEYPEYLENVSVGDQVVVTHSKAVVIAIEKQITDIPSDS
jgi:hypothetical protein